MDHGNGVALKI